MANDFVMIKNLLFQKFNNVPIIVQKSNHLFFYGWNIYFYQLKTILSTTYENYIFGEILKANGFKLIGQRSSLFSKLLIIWIKEEV
jgi:hypothetical protein